MLLLLRAARHYGNSVLTEIPFFAMRRIRSRLTDNGVSALLVSAVALILALGCCVLLTYHAGPRYGVRVRPEAAHFVMGSYDRSQTHIVSVAAGDEPRLYIGSELVPGGMAGIEEQLTRWDCETPARVTVVLVADRAVAAGTLQKLADMVLCHGFNCCLGAVPSVE